MYSAEFDIILDSKVILCSLLKKVVCFELLFGI